MSYCVNCGVELAPSEKKCPLCGVTVNNPKTPFSEAAKSPYPPNIEAEFKNINVKFGGMLALLILLIPAATTLLCNILINQTVSWSLYVVGACVCAAVWFVLPFVARKMKPYWFISFNSLATALYLALIAYLTGGFSWYLMIALPITVSFYLYTLAVFCVARRKSLYRLVKAALALILTGLLCVSIDSVIHNYLYGVITVSWSIVVICVCLVFSAVFVVLHRKRVWLEEIRKRLFI